MSTLVVKASGDPMSLAQSLRKEVWAVDPNQPIVKVQTMDDVIADSIWRPRFTAWIFSVLGAMALLLTCTGVYSVVAYTTALRSHEVGIRVALGATPADVVGGVLRAAMIPLMAGTRGKRRDRVDLVATAGELALWDQQHRSGDLPGRRAPDRHHRCGGQPSTGLASGYRRSTGGPARRLVSVSG